MMRDHHSERTAPPVHLPQVSESIIALPPPARALGTSLDAVLAPDGPLPVREEAMDAQDRSTFLALPLQRPCLGREVADWCGSILRLTRL